LSGAARPLRRFAAVRSSIYVLAGVVFAWLLVGASAALAQPVLTEAPGSPFASGAGADAVAFSPDGKLLVTADQANVNLSVFSVAPDGTLAPVPGSPFPIGTGSYSIAFSPSANLLAVAGSDEVMMFSVASDGTLTPVGSPFSTGSGSDPYSVAFNPSGNLLATADAGTDQVSVFSVAADGTLTQVLGSPAPAGTDPVSVAFSSTGLLATANEMGMGSYSSLSMFSVASDGTPTAVGTTVFPTNTGAFSLAFNPGGNLLATADYSGFVSEFTVAAGGTLDPVGGSPFSTGSALGPYAVAFDPSGNLLATADGGSNQMSAFSVGSGGALTQVAGSPYPTGGSPESLAISPTGGLIATANYLDGNVSVYSLAPPTASIASPTSGGTYALNEAVPTQFSCADSTYGPGITSCTDSGGASGGTGALPTTSLGTHTYTVSAISKDGQSETASITYTVVVAPPRSTATPPAITGTAKAGKTLTCATTGAFTGSPAVYGYQWYRDGTAISGATRSTYTVQKIDEGSTLTCVVTAVNTAGHASALSKGVAVPVPNVARCPKATGHLSGTTLGLIHLGLTRKQAQHAYRHSSDHGKRYEDFFCLTPIGIRIGIASPKLEKTLPRSEQSKLKNRIIWASTTNPTYSLDGVRAGATVSAASARLRLSKPFTIGLNTWYLARQKAATAVLKVRHGIVEEIGIGANSLTKTRTAQRTFLTSFY
jgi:6-phosphogluconolactonase (cycloisomerase 2 family)